MDRFSNFFSPTDSWQNFLCIHTKTSNQPHLQCVATLPCEIRKSKNVTEFSRWMWQCIWL